MNIIKTLDEVSEKVIARYPKHGKCWAVSVYAKELLFERGIDTRIVMGYAGLRMGSNEVSCMLFHPETNIKIESDYGFMFHAWLEDTHGSILDFSTYGYKDANKELDEYEGVYTHISYCPKYLFVRKNKGTTFKKFRTSRKKGVFFYEEIPNMEEDVNAHFQVMGLTIIK